mmetsp:Transcript_19861/g.50066  ORF Transcript_19861/g.50066 Transcript_19861/m.50066 type:complete len:260 (-) Transcript_19861:2379-3158(-)
MPTPCFQTALERSNPGRSFRDSLFCPDIDLQAFLGRYCRHAGHIQHTCCCRVQDPRWACDRVAGIKNRRLVFFCQILSGHPASDAIGKQAPRMVSCSMVQQVHRGLDPAFRPQRLEHVIDGSTACVTYIAIRNWLHHGLHLSQQLSRRQSSRALNAHVLHEDFALRSQIEPVRLAELCVEGAAEVEGGRIDGRRGLGLDHQHVVVPRVSKVEEVLKSARFVADVETLRGESACAFLSQRPEAGPQRRPKAFLAVWVFLR